MNIAFTRGKFDKYGIYKRKVSVNNILLTSIQLKVYNSLVYRVNQHDLKTSISAYANHLLQWKCKYFTSGNLQIFQGTWTSIAKESLIFTIF